MSSLLQQPLSELPFVVVDVETTGLRPKTDRIVEIAVADVQGGAVKGLLIDTLVDPQRDIGATRVHGITAEMVIGAPCFADVAPAVSAALDGAAVVGHNLSFDLRFIGSETSSAGLGEPVRAARLCTLSLARRLFRGACESYKLEALCARFGLRNPHAHSASGDVLVTAELLSLLLAEATRQGLRTLGDLVELGSAHPPPEPGGVRPSIPTVRQQRRDQVRGALAQRRSDFMTRVVSARRDAPHASNGEHLDPYLELLDRILRDRVIDGDEQAELASLIDEWGLGHVDLVQAHRAYLEGLVTAAWADGVLTGPEREDLERVADLLAVSRTELESMITSARRAPFNAPIAAARIGEGKTICFTGAFEGPRGCGMSRSEAEALAVQAGFRVLSGVTKKLDLLVVADPNTMSSKAKKARSYGTEIMAEAVFWRQVGLA